MFFRGGRRNRDPHATRLNVHASARQVLWETCGEHVHVRGLRFRHAANQAQAGAVLLKGNHGWLEDCLIEQTSASRVAFLATGLVTRRCTFRDNGRLVFNATATDLLITDCLCENNNVKNFSRDWEFGGNKPVRCRNAVIEPADST